MSLPEISITHLLKSLWPAGADPHVSAQDIALAISHIFTNQLSPVQTGALLTCLHFTGRDCKPDVIAECAAAMRAAAAPIDRAAVEEVVKRKGRAEGNYHGGLVSNLQLISSYIY
jgi:anthranilate phosphoribosyltransferase